MKNILFACDIDNTVLYSYKHKREGDVCVEYKDGKEQGFMPCASYELWGRLNEVAEIVPVTTRSVEQYSRIRWPYGLAPTYALTTNGGILLENGRICNGAGYGEITFEEEKELSFAVERLSGEKIFRKCRVVDGKYLFLCCQDEVEAAEGIKAAREVTGLALTVAGRKIYATPRGVDKRSGLERFLQSHDFSFVICAGDSEPDKGMLSIADAAIVPYGFENFEGKRILRANSTDVFELFSVKNALIAAEEYCK